MFGLQRASWPKSLTRSRRPGRPAIPLAASPAAPPTTFPSVLLPAFLAALLAPGCGGDEPPELKQAAGAIAYMAAPANLARSMFAAAYPACRPSEFVGYLFSAMGTAEWPPGEDSVDPYEVETARALGAPVLPAGVAIVPFRRHPDLGTQLVVRADDAAGVVILEGFRGGDTGPVLRREIGLPRVEADPLARRLFESSAEMGIDFRHHDHDR